MSRFIDTFGVFLLLLIVQMASTEALFEYIWYRGQGAKQKQDYTTKQEDSRTTTTSTSMQKYVFDIESPVILSGGIRAKQLYERSVALSKEDSCWQEAYTSLQSTCRDILKDETHKSRMALRFTNCFLNTTGRSLLKKCPENRPVASCVKELDNHNHAIFLKYYIDSSAMCHHLQYVSFFFYSHNPRKYNNLQ